MKTIKTVVAAKAAEKKELTAAQVKATAKKVLATLHEGTYRAGGYEAWAVTGDKAKATAYLMKTYNWDHDDAAKYVRGAFRGILKAS